VGVASLLAQLTRERRVDDMIGAERTIDGLAENERGSGLRDGDVPDIAA
jgi:hypothetical protein